MKDDPYRPPCDLHDAIEQTAALDPESLAIYAALPILVGHACAFRSGLLPVFTLKSPDDPSFWYGYLLFGNSEFGYWFAAIGVGLVWSELIQWWIRTSRAFARGKRRTRVAALTLISIFSLAATFGFAVLLQSV